MCRSTSAWRCLRVRRALLTGRTRSSCCSTGTAARRWGCPACSRGSTAATRRSASRPAASASPAGRPPRATPTRLAVPRVTCGLPTCATRCATRRSWRPAGGRGPRATRADRGRGRAPTAAPSRCRWPRCATARRSPTARSCPGRAAPGVPMQIAVAAPRITWSDFSYSMLPNGSTLDYLADAPYTGPTGVRKQSQEDGLYGNRPLVLLRRRGRRSRRRHLELARADGRRRALRRRRRRAPAGGRGHARRAHRASLALLHRPLAAACAAAALERLDRRPVPGGRSDPLLQPHEDRAPVRADRDVQHGLRPSARAGQGRGPPAAERAPPGVVRPLPARARDRHRRPGSRRSPRPAPAPHPPAVHTGRPRSPRSRPAR